MSSSELPQEFLERLALITKKRPKTVIDHIVEHGYITTEELKTLYGYDHPPRAARDVREEGIPLETFYVKSGEGRSIGAYKFGDISKVRNDRLGGRTVFSKEFKQKLVATYGAKCTVCSGHFEERYLQIDHRVPYEVAGDSASAERAAGEYMLVCGSCNRAKSWSCEHCANWLEKKDPSICNTCYWASPESYQHIAMRNIRRLDVVWDEDEVAEFEKLQQEAEQLNSSIPEYVKAVLRKLR